MNAKIALVIFLGLLIGALSLAYSQPPTPGAGEHNKAPQSETEKHHQASKEQQQPASYWIIKVQNNTPSFINDETPRTKQNKENNQSPQNRGWITVLVKIISISTNILLALFTGALAIFSLLQVKLMKNQVQELKNTVEVTRKTADAAKTSADAFQVAERAWVSNINVMIHPFTNATVIDTGDKMNGVMFVIEWINSGRTPAIHCSLLTQRQTIKRGENIPTFNHPPNLEQRQAPLIPGVKVMSPPCHFADTEINALHNREIRLFIHGRADYQTIFFGDISFYTEVTLEVEHGGFRGDNGQVIFNFSAIGPQNSAT